MFVFFNYAVDTPNRKRKHSEGDDTVDNDQDRYEKKRHSAILYQRYLQRGGPKHHGSKEVPKVQSYEFSDLIF